MRAPPDPAEAPPFALAHDVRRARKGILHAPYALVVCLFVCLWFLHCSERTPDEAATALPTQGVYWTCAHRQVNLASVT